MTSAIDKKADAFVTKLAHSLASSAYATPQPSASSVVTHFRQAIEHLPTSKFRTHLLDNFANYTPRIQSLYSKHLHSPPPTQPLGLHSREAFDGVLERLSGVVESDVVLCESLLLCSNCPSNVLSTYFRLQLSTLPATPLPLPALHRVLSCHRRTAALVAGLDACVEWAEGQLSQQLSTCEWLSATLDRLTSLFTMHARAVPDTSPASRNAVLSRLCRLLVLGVVWRGKESSLSAYTAHVTRTLAVWEPPPAAVKVDAQLLFVCQWCALLQSDSHEQRASAAVASSSWLAADRLPAILDAILPAITRSLPLSSVHTRTIAFVRLAILHSILPSSDSDRLVSRLSIMASLPLPPALVSLWPSDGRAAKGAVPSVEQWVRRAQQAMSERTLLQQLIALNAVGSEVETAVASDTSESGEHKAVAFSGQAEAEDQVTMAGYGWFDDRKGDMDDPLDGQLHSLITNLREASRDTDVEADVDSALNDMMQQTGENQPIAAEEQAVARQSEQTEGPEDNDELSTLPTTSLTEPQEEQVEEQNDVAASAPVADDSTASADPLPPPLPPATRTKKRAKAEKRSVRVSPRHTRSGTKL